MDFEYDEACNMTKCVAYKDVDICCKCSEVIRNKCPLMLCLANNYVYPCAESLEMTSCKLYDYIKQIERIKEKSDLADD